MTREEMVEAIQRVGELLDTALPRNDTCRVIGSAQGLLASVLAALEAEPCGNKQPLAVNEHCIGAFDAWISPATYQALKRDGFIGGGFVVRTYPGGSHIRVIILDEAAP